MRSFDRGSRQTAAKTLCVLTPAGILDTCAHLGQRHFPPGEITSKCGMSFALSAAALFVRPSRDGNFPDVVLEAMACGTPVASFGVGGMAELMRTGETGILTNAHSGSNRVSHGP